MRKNETKQGNFHLYACIAITGWSLAYVFTRLAREHFSVYSLGFLRYFIASCLLAFVVKFSKLAPPAKKDLGLFAASGGVGYFLYVIVFNVGAATLTAAAGSVIVSTAPVITAIIARCLYGEKMSTFQWLATAVEFSGVLILALKGGPFTVNCGVLWLSLGALLLGSYNVIQRKLTQSYSALQASSYSIFAGTAMLAIFSPPSIGEVMSASPLALFYLGILGVFSSALGYVAWSKALEVANNTFSVSNYMFLTPFLAAVWGFLIAQEMPDAPTVLGSVVILAGMALFSFERTQGAKRQRPHNIA
jgi:drug/metabolite transporter (DMT)-like permease